MKIKSKKKIAILYSGGRFFGGIEQYLINLFKNIDQEMFEVELISLGEWPLTDRLKKDYPVKFFSSKRVNPASIFKIGRFLKKNKFDLLVSQGVVSNFYARKISFLYQVPNLVTVHSDIANDYPNKFVRFVYVAADRLTRFITKRYVAVSKHIKQQLVESGLPGEKIDVIYNGVEFPDVAKTSHHGIVIGSAGRLHPVKGYDLLIKAFAKLDHDEAILKIAGDGSEKERLSQLASELGVADRIEFVGFQKDIYKFMRGLDIYVQPSRSEGFGLTVAEAMSQELPVIVTPAGSLKEIVKNGETGFVCKGFEASELAGLIEKVIGDLNDLGRIKKDARRFVKINFDEKFWAENTKRAYLEAMK